MRYESTDWSLEVPNGWSHESDEDCAAFFHPEGLGALQVSSYRKVEPATDEDLREFAGDIPLTPVSFPRFSGFRIRYSEDDTFWTKWWLRAGGQVIYVTYNCSLADRGREDTEINATVESLTPKHEITS